MKFQLLLLTITLAITSCAQSTKSQISSSEPEMNKVDNSDIDAKITKEMNKRNFNEAKLQGMPVSKTMPSSVLTCTAGSDVRVLEIISADQKGCELQYTKNGDTKTVANANFNLSYCETVQTRISDKLKTAGFNCQ